MVYDERSVYGLTRVIKNSVDPVAQSIALNELLDLLDLQKTHPPDPSLALLSLAGNSTNVTAADLTARQILGMGLDRPSTGGALIDL